MPLKEVSKRILSLLEVRFVLKLVNVLSEGCYYLKHAEIEDFVRYLEDVEVEEDTDGLTYLKTIRGIYGDKSVELNLWSCGISVVRKWVTWV